MKQFLTSLYVFIRLYLMGYSWSGGFDFHSGFYRLNYTKSNQKEYAILDIDFNTKKPSTFSHMHGGRDNATIFRVDDNRITHSSKLKFGEKSIAFYDLMDTATTAAIYIAMKTGGMIRIVHDEKLQIVIFKWKKYDEIAKKMLHFDYALPYDELDKVEDPQVFGQTILDKYNSKELIY